MNKNDIKSLRTDLVRVILEIEKLKTRFTPTSSSPRTRPSCWRAATTRCGWRAAAATPKARSSAKKQSHF